jgi:hypothetical protein
MVHGLNVLAGFGSFCGCDDSYAPPLSGCIGYQKAIDINLKL